jgi:Periplasmic binding protein-like domain
VPDDIAVVGFDDIFPASLCQPPLTTVHQSIRKLGERACERLIERIADPSLRPRVEILPTELVLRTSCGCPPGKVERRLVNQVPHRGPAVARRPAVPVARTVPVESTVPVASTDQSTLSVTNMVSSAGTVSSTTER